MDNITAISIFETEISTIDPNEDDAYLRDIREAFILGIEALKAYRSGRLITIAKDYYGFDVCTCSKCGKVMPRLPFKFCPECGIKFDIERK